MTKTLKIVYVDDEPDMCQMFHDNFASETIRIAMYSDMTDIVQKIKDEDPDLVILDYRLLNTTGDDIAKELSPELPKLLITGDLTVEPKSQFHKVIPKPFDFDQMAALLESFRNLKSTP